MGLGKYLKSAFFNHWNLLAFLGGLAFAGLSGAADVAVPLVMAAEVGYLGMLGTHPKFQRYVDAQEAKAARGEASQSADEALRRIVQALPRPMLRKFEALRGRCRELSQIALDLKDPGRPRQGASLDDVQLSGLDRLLWIYLRLLFTDYSLSRFFEATDREEMQADIERAEARIRETEASTTANRDRLLATLRDSLQTFRDRLANYDKAHDNHQLVRLEIERLEAKIRSLSELAVNRQEPDFISGQVSSVADSMLETERTMNELRFVTGLEADDDHVPELVRREAVQSR